jgi:hypothetical protein
VKKNSAPWIQLLFSSDNFTVYGHNLIFEKYFPFRKSNSEPQMSSSEILSHWDVNVMTRIDIFS